MLFILLCTNVLFKCCWRLSVWSKALWIIIDQCYTNNSPCLIQTGQSQQLTCSPHRLKVWSFVSCERRQTSHHCGRKHHTHSHFPVTTIKMWLKLKLKVRQREQLPDVWTSLFSEQESVFFFCHYGSVRTFSRTAVIVIVPVPAPQENPFFDSTTGGSDTQRFS